MSVGEIVAELLAKVKTPASDRQNDAPMKKIGVTALREFTRSLAPAKESAVDLIRHLRDESY